MRGVTYSLDLNKFDLIDVEARIDMVLSDAKDSNERAVAEQSVLLEACSKAYPNLSLDQLKLVSKTLQFWLTQSSKRMPESKHYVYVVTVDDTVRYIGSGKGDRWQHTLKGSSSCPQLNRDLFEGKQMRCYHVLSGLTKASAINMELLLIQMFKDDKGTILYNKHRRKPKGVCKDYQDLHYILASEWFVLAGLNGYEPYMYFENTDNILLNHDQFRRDYIYFHKRFIEEVKANDTCNNTR